jgi:hypothetical protein
MQMREQLVADNRKKFQEVAKVIIEGVHPIHIILHF